MTCQIEPGERIGLLGRNGSGKTTLMRILCGEVEPDMGELLAPGTRVALLPQDVPQDIEGRVADMVARAAAGRDSWRGPEEGWKAEQQVKQILSRTSLAGRRSI